MPTYQYSCTECGHFFEQFQSFSEDSLTVCPQCEGRLRKVFNAVGVVFKGSGFYRTDSRSASSGGETAATGSDSGSDSGSKPSKEKTPTSGAGGSTGGDSSSSTSTPTSSKAGSAA